VKPTHRFDIYLHDDLKSDVQGRVGGGKYLIRNNSSAHDEGGFFWSVNDRDSLEGGVVMYVFIVGRWIELKGGGGELIIWS
jgi:hypothetical protein